MVPVASVISVSATTPTLITLSWPEKDHGIFLNLGLAFELLEASILCFINFKAEGFSMAILQILAVVFVAMGLLTLVGDPTQSKSRSTTPIKVKTK